MTTARKRVVVVGGGFFGMYIAEHCANSGHDTLLIEREQQFMSRSSYNNQARIHNGYHYPRSILTALRSRISFPRFVNEFRDCVDSEFEKYYLIGSPLSHVSAAQFRKFCDRIGASCETAPDRIRRLTNPHFVEACFSTVEYAFDANKLRKIMLQRLEAASVTTRLGVSAETIQGKDDRLSLTLKGEEAHNETIEADHVFNCTYSNLNYLLATSEIAPIPLKHELTEMCVVEVPDEIRKMGLTVMCGPFFSVMPFPSLGLHSFSHVRYTPHCEWLDERAGTERPAAFFDPDSRPSAWQHMRKDAARYIPILSECRYERSLWEVKTVLPRSETDDSRPILFRPDHGIRGLHCILGGKIDNVYDAVEAIDSHGILTRSE